MLLNPTAAISTNDSIRLYNAAQSKQLDQSAQQTHHIPGILLMKRAAWFSWQIIRQQCPNTQQLIILCGTGSNGGDGFMLAQYAKLAGIESTVYLYGADEKISGDARIAYREWQKINGLTLPLENLIPSEIDAQMVLVDALFGTGLNRELKPNLSKILHKLAHTPAPICALDLPSGLDCDSGNLLGYALSANFTCSFITPKLGCFTQQGPDVCGQIFFSDLNLNHDAPDLLLQAPYLANSRSLQACKNALPRRHANTHKGNQGSALLIGGNRSMMGAIQLAASSALKSGCGLCKVVSQNEHLLFLSAQQPEVMGYDISHANQLILQADAIAIGPGLGTDEWARKLLQQTLQKPTKTPIVIDADGLKLLAENPNMEPIENLICTPHPGEAALLLGCTTADIQRDRIAAIKTLQQKYGGVMVLKGNGSLIYDGTHLELCRAGNPGMAIGGMGDVLTGTIVALLAQGLSAFDAACLGVHLHANAADSIAQQKGQAGLLPSELGQCYPQLLG
ncbi:bifunctional NAD(P)H-hydrate repair enzyme Nnr [Thiosulfatimonas sediminis]|uniref:Bifunctional NAD(P)H-hydrate repair enzyme n=1 Tax=Thiosulfatimonas sediminis TaxID=2675054 RepID=A0A6F8PXI0_9GAMM|nr:NAD(P)H-hydrate dehydratase [Thiosulfatimonas sediminis]BBP46747.1 bifunctional NAD(P)H-hydrate repair enzyme Nnr [Thiosulfatimonas sediminis]